MNLKIGDEIITTAGNVGYKIQNPFSFLGIVDPDAHVFYFFEAQDWWLVYITEFKTTGRNIPMNLVMLVLDV